MCVCGHWLLFFFFFKQKTADEMRISDWSSDVCSSVLRVAGRHDLELRLGLGPLLDGIEDLRDLVEAGLRLDVSRVFLPLRLADEVADVAPHRRLGAEVDVGGGVGLSALALDDPARLDAAGVVTGPQHGLAEGNALAVLPVFLQRTVPPAPLVARLTAARSQERRVGTKG